MSKLTICSFALHCKTTGWIVECIPCIQDWSAYKLKTTIFTYLSLQLSFITKCILMRKVSHAGRNINQYCRGSQHLKSTHGKERIETICCIYWSLNYIDEITKSAYRITTTWLTCCNFQLWNTGWHHHHQQLCEIVRLPPSDSGSGVKSGNLAMCYITAMSLCAISYHGRTG